MLRQYLSFRLRRHINQLVPLKHRAIEVAATIIVLHPANRCGSASSGEGGDNGSQGQRFPGSRGRRGGAVAAACCWVVAACCWAYAACCWAAAPSAYAALPTTTAVLRLVRRRTPRIAWASGTSCSNSGGTIGSSMKRYIGEEHQNESKGCYGNFICGFHLLPPDGDSG